MAKINITMSLAYSETGGDTVKGVITESITQAGTKAFGNIQAVGTASEAVVLGDVTGAKFVLFKNKDLANTVYIDTATPATTAAAIKLLPGQGVMFPTTVDVFNAISVGGSCDTEVIAVQQ